MQRRHFLRDSAAAAALAMGSPLTAAEGDADQREFLELRSYFVKPGRRERLDEYLQQALLPALRRISDRPVGVFYEESEEAAPPVWVLIAHQDASGPVQLAAQFAADSEYTAAAARLLSGPSSESVYDRFESSLLGGIAGMPRMVLPDPGPRLFNLRIYESFNAVTLARKIEMFNEGELDIFRRVGLTPVYFAETLVGQPLPSLNYLLVFPDDDARTTAWQTFRTDPAWIKLKAIPEYADAKIVARITNKLLKPAEYSQI